MTHLMPFYEQIQSHYDVSNEFFALFLDPSMTYSCAYFARANMTLAEAQAAKNDLALSKCDLRPGMRLLDVGCGWGATARRAAEKYGVQATGLTLSRNQYQYANEQQLLSPPLRGEVDFRLMGWEEFDEPIDRIVSIGAFEHFRFARYAEFFTRCRELLPADGRMLLQSIVWPDPPAIGGQRFGMDRDQVEYAKFIRREIFPGGQLCLAATIIEHAKCCGFRVVQTQSLQQHYARTLDCWLVNLTKARNRAIAVASQQVYDRFIRYLRESAKYFKSGDLDVMQFTLAATRSIHDSVPRPKSHSSLEARHGE